MLEFGRSKLGPCLIFLCFGFVVPDADGSSLQSSCVTEEYRETVTTALKAFGFWFACRSLPKIGKLVAEPLKIQAHLVDYLQHVLDNGYSLPAMRHTVLVLQTLHRQLHGYLRFGWDSIRCWEPL